MATERTGQIIDGKKIANEIQAELKSEIEAWIKSGHRAPCLKAILIGENAASMTYVEKKMEASKNIGINSETIRIPSTITESELIAKIEEFNKDENIDGILIQLPVPEHISEKNVCNAVDEKKDVDGFNIVNFGKLCLNMETFVPATALAVVELLKRVGIETKAKNAVVCGRSKNVGLAIAMILHSDANHPLPGCEATTILCHRSTPPENLVRYCQNADIIISATGVVNLIKGDMVKPGACVIDVGLTRIQTPEGKTKLVGDVDFEGAKKVAGHITPVPGGVGPMTVAMLMKNTLKAAKYFAQKKK